MKILTIFRSFALPSAALLLSLFLLPSIASAQNIKAGVDPTTNAEAYGDVIITVDDNKTVPVSGTHKWTTSTHCTVKLTKPSPEDVDVVLVNPLTPSGTGKALFHLISFGGAGADGTLKLTLPKGGGSKDFYITGNAPGSRSVGDATIEAHRESNNNLLDDEDVTAWWLNAPRASVVKGTGIYALVDDPDYPNAKWLASAVGPAVLLQVEVFVEPKGVSSPAITKLQMGLVQNIMPDSFSKKIYDNPEWETVFQRAGEKVKAAQYYESKLTWNLLTTDGNKKPEQTERPFYAAPVPLKSHDVIWFNVDSPGIHNLVQTLDVPVLTDKGNATQLKWHLNAVDYVLDFSDFNILHNTDIPKTDAAQAFQAIAQTGWFLSIHNDSSGVNSALQPQAADQSVTATGIQLDTDPSNMGSNTTIPSSQYTGDPVTFPLP